MDGALGMILVRNWRTKEGHEAVAQELIDGALVPVDLLEHQRKGTVHQLVHVFRVELLGNRREPRDIGEQYRYLLALPFEGSSRGQDLFGQVPGGIAERGLEWRGWRLPGKGGGALPAERKPGQVHEAALQTAEAERAGTLTTKPHPLRIVKLTAGAAHERLLHPV